MYHGLFTGCVSFFYHFFYFLEDCGLLHIAVELDLYALHFAFMPMIQEKLDAFRLGWSHHSMRTENCRTPMQLWVSGLLEMDGEVSQHPARTGIDAVSALMYDAEAQCSVHCF